MNRDLKIIKKKYGEEMMHLCRNLFPTILEEEGKLSALLLDHFEPSHDLYNDLLNENLMNDFKDYINSLLNIKVEQIVADKTPEELLNEVGYILYECKSEEDIQKFKKYYEPHEELCTFKGGRLKSCRVFFAVKKNVDEIKREDFKKTNRQDEYGTSVISIQFTRSNNTLSIKNRYNHTVSNPDATFSNNLDNIILGLTASFEKYYGIKTKYIPNNFEITNYIIVNNKYYKFYDEINNIYYCQNNIIIKNFEVIKYPKEKFLVFECFLLDLQNKKIEIIDKENITDSFVAGLQNIIDIHIKKTSEGKIILLTPESGEIIEIELDKNNFIISYKNNNLIKVEDDFMYLNEKLKKIELNNLESVGNYFLDSNIELTEISFPKLQSVGWNFISLNENISKAFLPRLEIVGMYFFSQNLELLELSLPEVLVIDCSFLENNKKLKRLDLPKVKKIESCFLYQNLDLMELSLPNVKYIRNDFLNKNVELRKLILPKLKEINFGFLCNNQFLENIYLPRLKFASKFALSNNMFICLDDIIASNNNRDAVRELKNRR